MPIADVLNCYCVKGKKLIQGQTVLHSRPSGISRGFGSRTPRDTKIH